MTAKEAVGARSKSPETTTTSSREIPRSLSVTLVA
jgi:hypothetical protein